jgi:hypothetical protein
MDAWFSASEKMATAASSTCGVHPSPLAHSAAITAMLAENPEGNSRHSGVPLSWAKPASSSRCCVARTPRPTPPVRPHGSILVQWRVLGLNRLLGLNRVSLGVVRTQ